MKPWVATLVFALVALPCLAERDLVAPTDAISTCVHGDNSMAPTIRCGQLIHVVKVPFTRALYRKIIVWRWYAREINVNHRVVDVRWAANGEMYLITQGDNNPEPDLVHVIASEFRGLVVL